MDIVAKQLCVIANELQKIQGSHIIVSSNQIRTAGFFTKMFAKGMTEQSKKQVEQVVQLLTQDNCAPTVAMLMKGKVKDLQSLMQPLKKTKQTNEYFDMFMSWFKDCWDKIPKSVKTKSEKIDDNQLQKQLNEDTFLKTIRDQFAQEINKLAQAVKNAQVAAGQATDSWQDAWKGWGGFAKAQ